MAIMYMRDSVSQTSLVVVRIVGSGWILDVSSETEAL